VKEISGQVVNVIRHAIKLEINGRSFFNHATEVTHNELGKKMFRKLAQDETEHLDAFGKLFTALTGGEEWKKVVDPDEVKGDSYLIDELTSSRKLPGNHPIPRPRRSWRRYARRRSSITSCCRRNMTR
jgi:rubrerythrin